MDPHPFSNTLIKALTRGMTLDIGAASAEMFWSVTSSIGVKILITLLAVSKYHM